MTPSQCRAARALLNWTQQQIANVARVSVVTIRNFENEKSTPQRATLDVIQRAFESAGVEFTNGDRPGVRLIRPAERPATAATRPAKTSKKG
jgi:transcriptional regulator with XRE-family HTH domain